MKVSSIQQNITYTQHFGAVKFQPPIKEWNPRILEAVLDSSAVKHAIKENESNGLDTLLYYVNKDKHECSVFTEKINEFGVVKLKESRDNFSCRFETFGNREGIESIINFIKTKDSEFNIPKKFEEFKKLFKIFD